MERHGQRLGASGECNRRASKYESWVFQPGKPKLSFMNFPITPYFSEYTLHSQRLACHLCSSVVWMRRKSSTCQTLKRPRDDTQDICERIRGYVFARQSSQRQAQTLEIEWAQEGSGQILPRPPSDPNCTEHHRPTSPWAATSTLLDVHTTPCAHE